MRTASWGKALHCNLFGFFCKEKALSSAKLFSARERLFFLQGKGFLVQGKGLFVQAGRFEFATGEGGGYA